MGIDWICMALANVSYNPLAYKLPSLSQIANQPRTEWANTKEKKNSLQL